MTGFYWLLRKTNTEITTKPIGSLAVVKGGKILRLRRRYGQEGAWPDGASLHKRIREGSVRARGPRYRRRGHKKKQNTALILVPFFVQFDSESQSPKITQPLFLRHVLGSFLFLISFCCPFDSLRRRVNAAKVYLLDGKRILRILLASDNEITKKLILSGKEKKKETTKFEVLP